MATDFQRVALDVAPVRSQPAGVGLYVANLARELAAVDPSLAVIGLRPEARALDTLPAVIARRLFRTPTYHAWVQVAADRDARSVGARLVHFTNAAAPLFGRMPYVLTVHDLSVARMPRSHPVSRWPILPVNLAAFSRARAIIVPSRFTARELGRIGVSARRIVVIPHAPTLSLPAGDADSVLRRLGIEARDYILYFGTLEPRKNIARLVEAFERLAAERPGLRLVLAGAPGWHYAGIARRIAQSPRRDRITVAGYVPADDLAALISMSAVVAYVSLYEGFGMPVVDALALGAPVVTSNLTAMPEAARGAAELVDPRDVGDIARGISAALGRPAERERRAPPPVAARTWGDVAGEHLDVYRFALSR